MNDEDIKIWKGSALPSLEAVWRQVSQTKDSQEMLGENNRYLTYHGFRGFP
jgi:hypothetical protein